jgi:cyclopropane-fatty-acyl-phospholipid synthase
MAMGVEARAINWTESGLIPDAVIRTGIRRLLERKAAEIRSGEVDYAARKLNDFVAMMNSSPIALAPELPNEQHYEVPAEFFTQVLGTNRKYSCCYWPQDIVNLDEAEAAALAMTVERAGIEDGMRVLDLGCGWGSLSLWIAEHFPRCQVTSVSNSLSQREFITGLAAKRKVENIEVIVCDMNDFDAPGSYDRVVSIEMFEHMRNYGELFRKIDRWLSPGGKFFMHIFCHRTTPYEYVDNGPSDWMSRHFFSGGIMPSVDLPLRFPNNLNVEKTWRWNGLHYAKTCRAWLENMDAREDEVRPIIESTYGTDNMERWFMRWRMFFMACEELFRYEGGNEWFISHYLFRKAGE